MVQVWQVVVRMRIWQLERTQWLGWPFFDRSHHSQYVLFGLENIISVPTYSLMIAHEVGLEVGTLGGVEDTDEGETVGGFMEVIVELFWLIYLPNLMRRSSKIRQKETHFCIPQ